MATIDELDAFLFLYEEASNSCNFDKVELLIADGATFWFTNGTYNGKTEIRNAFEETWSNIKDEKYTISGLKWVIVASSVAVCTYNFKSDGFVDGKHQIYSGHGTNVLVKNGSNWQIIHEHLSKLPES